MKKLKELTLFALIQCAATVVSLFCQPNFSISLLQNCILFSQFLSIELFIFGGLAVVILSFLEIFCCLVNETICFYGGGLDEGVDCPQDFVVDSRKTSISLREKSFKNHLFV